MNVNFKFMPLYKHFIFGFFTYTDIKIYLLKLIKLFSHNFQKQVDISEILNLCFIIDLQPDGAKTPPIKW